MQINRQGQPPIVIGKRVVLGQMILSAFNMIAGIWDWLNPENPIPAALIGVTAQVVTGLAQIWVVNKYGVTTGEPQ